MRTETVGAFFLAACLACSEKPKAPTQAPAASVQQGASPSSQLRAPANSSGSFAGIVPFLDTCDSTPSGPNVVVLTCGVLTLKVMRPQTVDFGRLTEMLGDGWVRESLRFGQTSLPAAVLTGEHPRMGFAVEAMRGADRRFVTCFVDRSSAGGERCRGALKELVVDGHVWEVAFTEINLRIGSQTLNVPKGCVLIGSDRIRCPEAELHWRAPNPKCRLTTEQARAGFEQMLREAGDFTHGSHRCTVLGEKLTCELYSLTAPGQEPVTIVASIRGCSLPMVQCNLFEPLGRQFPQPCDQVLSNDP